MEKNSGKNKAKTNKKKSHDKVRKIRYEEQNQVRKKKKFNWGKFFSITLLISIIAALILFLFYTRKIEINGLNITTEKEMNEWLKKDPGNKNTIYSYVKMNYLNCKYPPAVESVDVKLTRPWEMVLDVHEKKIEGFVKYKDKYLCFDSEGTAIYISPYPLEECTFIEGMKINDKEVKLGEIIPVGDDDVFDNIVDISRITEKYSLDPDRIVCDNSNIKLYFGDIEVLLGKEDYEIRLAQLPPILRELQENYSDEKGTLHLENFHASDKSVRFVPEIAEEE